MYWQRWPLWPVVCSCCLHALLLAFPARFGPRTNLPEVTDVGILEVRLTKITPAEPSMLAVTDGTQELTVLPIDQAAPRMTSSLMPDPPPIALHVPDRYFSSSEVDQKAEPIEVAPLIYPADAYLRRLPGNVTLRLYINEAGSIDSIDILAADPPGIFEQAAVDAVLATRFRPALLLTRPVKNVKTVEVRFDPLHDR